MSIAELTRRCVLQAPPASRRVLFGLALGGGVCTGLVSGVTFTPLESAASGPVVHLAGAGLGVLVGVLLGALVGGVLWCEWSARIEEPDRDPRTGAPVAGQPHEGLPRRIGLLVVSVALLLAMIVYIRVDAMLYSLHSPGEPRYSIDAAISPMLSPENRSSRVRDAVRTWVEYGSQPAARGQSIVAEGPAPPEPAQPRTPELRSAPADEQDRRQDARSRGLPRAAFLIDTVLLVPSLAILLTLLVGVSRRMLMRDRPAIEGTATCPVRDYLEWGKWALVPLGLAALADWLENAMSLASIDVLWARSPSPAEQAAQAVQGGFAGQVVDVASCAGLPTEYCGLFWLVLSLAVWMKWLGILLPIYYLLAACVLWLHHGGDVSQRWARLPHIGAAVRGLSLPLLVVTVFAAALFAPVSNEQVADIIRRWIDEPATAVAGLALTSLLAAAVGVSSHWLLRRPADLAPDGPTPGSFATAALLFYALLWPALWLISNGLPVYGWLPLTLMVELAAPVLAWIAILSRSSRKRVLVSLASAAVLMLVGAALWAAGCTSLPQLTITPPPGCDPWYVLRLLVPVILVLAIWALGFPISSFGDGDLAGSRTEQVCRSDVTYCPLRPPGAPSLRVSREVLPYFLGASPLMLLAVTTLTTGLDVLIHGHWAYTNPERATALLAAGMVALVASVTTCVVGCCVGSRVVAARRAAPTTDSGRACSLVIADADSHAEASDGRVYRRGPPVAVPVAMLAVGIAIWGGLIGYLAEEPEHLHWLAPSIGGLGLMCLTLILVTLVVTGAGSLVDYIAPHPPALLRFLGFRRTPLLSMLLVWAVVVSLLPPQDITHDVRTQARPDAPDRPSKTLQQSFDGWRQNQCIAFRPDDPPVTQQPKPAVPLIIVSSSGGGIRAAVWTTYVMDRVFGYEKSNLLADDAPCSSGLRVNRRPSSWIFAASGVSGGSVGLVTYAVRQADYDAQLGVHRLTPTGLQQPAPPAIDEEAPQPGSPPGWIRETLGQDGIAATLGWMTLVEVPWGLFRYPLARDRGAVLEETWERWWEQSLGRTPMTAGSRPPGEAAQDVPEWDTRSTLPRFFQLHQGSRDLPLLLLNGTSVESGCRFNGSVLVADGRAPEEVSTRCLAPRRRVRSGGLTGSGTLGATVDLADFVCPKRDLLASSAAFLSARFPVISPSGRLAQCDPARAQTGTDADGVVLNHQTFVVDGGYHETSGAATALDLWLALSPLVDAHNRHEAAPAYIVPFVIQIDNGYNEPASPGAVPASPQFVVPLVTFAAGMPANHERARQTARLIFEKPYELAPLTQSGPGARYCGGRYAHFAVQAHPGPAAPLGWTLSSVSFDDLIDQFKRNVVDTGTLTDVDQWLALPKTDAASLTVGCPGPGRPGSVAASR